MQEMVDVQLVKPLGYVIAAPLSDVLDALTLLSANQHVAVAAGVFALWASWALALSPPWRRGWRARLGSFGILVSCVGAAYLAAAFVPRPMAYLTSSDRDMMRVDFHS